ncbi:hypothetical protein O6H91_03G030500 [Diphasiastrum complanatum]|uniref:Uncharacterized protein n=1 Tax=Diphasiastrum complanatum TaxID=34168 RepID=A0ACC2E4N6_DIPCM|nr:hypothetical protein O6H91_03G030500 [Diphasiastrum complanatum]
MLLVRSTMQYLILISWFVHLMMNKPYSNHFTYHIFRSRDASSAGPSFQFTCSGDMDYISVLRSPVRNILCNGRFHFRHCFTSKSTVSLGRPSCLLSDIVLADRFDGWPFLPF